MQRQLVVVVDCRDPSRMVDFWTAALDYRESGRGGPYVTLVAADGDGPELLLQRVPESKTTKNRVHLDIRVADMRAEVERLERLGARRLHVEPIVERGWHWFVLADPEGNEFCCIQPPGPEPGPAGGQTGEPAVSATIRSTTSSSRPARRNARR